MFEEITCVWSAVDLNIYNEHVKNPMPEPNPVSQD